MASLVVVLEAHGAGDESGEVERLPEVVARTGVVAPGVGGCEARVDPDEDDVQALPQVVGQSPRAQFLLRQAAILILESVPNCYHNFIAKRQVFYTLLNRHHILNMDILRLSIKIL